MSKIVKRQYSDAFKSQVLEDYAHSRMSRRACCRKWEIPEATLRAWLPSCKNGKKVVSLHVLRKMVNKLRSFINLFRSPVNLFRNNVKNIRLLRLPFRNRVNLFQF